MWCISQVFQMKYNESFKSDSRRMESFFKIHQNSSTDQQCGNFPIDETHFLECFESCDGILCNAGFEGPAEALFMDKKLFVIPIHNQYEQECNACALDKIGIPNSKILGVEEIKNWVNSDIHFKANYPMILRILS